MFLVLIEYVDDGDREWNVCAHGKAGLRSIFPTREAAEDVAMKLAKDRGNRFSVVQIKSWYQQDESQVEEIHPLKGAI